MQYKLHHLFVCEIKSNKVNNLSKQEEMWRYEFQLLCILDLASGLFFLLQNFQEGMLCEFLLDESQSKFTEHGLFIYSKLSYKLFTEMRKT